MPRHHCKLGEAYRAIQSRRRGAITNTRLPPALDDKIAAAHAGLGLDRHAEAGNRPRPNASSIVRWSSIPGDQSNYFNLALVCEQTNDFEGSIKYCRGALKINDYMIAAHHLIAENLRLLGRKDEAERPVAIRSAIVAPYDDQARQMLGTITGRLHAYNAASRPASTDRFQLAAELVEVHVFPVPEERRVLDEIVIGPVGFDFAAMQEDDRSRSGAASKAVGQERSPSGPARCGYSESSSSAFVSSSSASVGSSMIKSDGLRRIARARPEPESLSRRRAVRRARR